MDELMLAFTLRQAQGRAMKNGDGGDKWPAARRSQTQAPVTFTLTRIFSAAPALVPPRTLLW
jgi:hypothetical protein